MSKNIEFIPEHSTNIYFLTALFTVFAVFSLLITIGFAYQISIKYAGYEFNALLDRLPPFIIFAFICCVALILCHSFLAYKSYIKNVKQKIKKVTFVSDKIVLDKSGKIEEIDFDCVVGIFKSNIGFDEFIGGKKKRTGIDLTDFKNKDELYYIFDKLDSNGKFSNIKSRTVEFEKWFIIAVCISIVVDPFLIFLISNWDSKPSFVDNDLFGWVLMIGSFLIILLICYIINRLISDSRKS